MSIGQMKCEVAPLSGPVGRTVLVHENKFAVSAHAAMEVDVRIAHLMACGPVAHDEQKHVRGRPVDEPVRGAAFRRKARAQAGA